MKPRLDDDYGPQPMPTCDVGDKVKAISPSSLHSGSGRYDYAIVVDIDAKRAPIVLVSPQGDMLWSKTVSHIRLEVCGKAHWRELLVALRRYESEKTT